MKKIRMFIAILLGKLAHITSKTLRGSSSFIGGTIAYLIYPDILKEIEKPKKIITVTGTNGKTTVNNMIINIVEKVTKKQTINNQKGSNIRVGIIDTLIMNAKLNGKLKEEVNEIGIFEVDERFAFNINEALDPDYTIITNILRDSVKRNANTEYIKYILDSSFTPKTTIIANGDDIIASSITKNNKIYYGMEKQTENTKTPINLVTDFPVCPVCFEKIEYEYAQINHHGKLYCKNGHIQSPELDAKILNIDKTNYTFTVRFSERYIKIFNLMQEEYTFKAISVSRFNVYNQLASIIGCMQLGLDILDIQKAILDLKITETRYYSKELKDNKLLIKHLCKGQNPFACSNVFHFTKQYKGSKNVVIMLDDEDDNKSGSEIVVWHYDADYEFLNDDSIKNIYIIGPRAADVFVRMKMANIPESKIQKYFNVEAALHNITIDNVDTLFILHDMYAEKDAQKIRQYIESKY